MAGLVKQTAVLTAARFANYGLMLISPIILVRLLSVEQFGQYRQFILYASFLQLVAAFSFADGLLYFIPTRPRSVWRIVGQTAVLVACSSAAVVILLAVADLLIPGRLVGADLLPLVAYVMCFVNLDFWECYFLATHRPAAVFWYSTVRLLGRMTLVVLLAYNAAGVRTIIWSLVLLEAVRLMGSALAWKRADRSADEPPLGSLWRDQLRYCVPTGIAMLLFMANRNLGGFSVSRSLGTSALAHYTIGTYADYVYLALGNSIAAALLPEMVRRLAHSKQDALKLWQRVTVVNCMLLLPAAAILARFATPIILTVFGQNYRPAVLVLQIHMLFLVRACLDFSPAVRALNNTRPLIYSNVAALIVNMVALAALLPRFGIVGAVSALVISSFVEAAVLGWNAMRMYNSKISEFIPWLSVGKVIAAALAAGAVVAAPSWFDAHGLYGVFVAACIYYLVFAVVLRILRVGEAAELLHQLQAWIVPLLRTERSADSVK